MDIAVSDQHDVSLLESLLAEEVGSHFERWGELCASLEKRLKQRFKYLNVFGSFLIEGNDPLLILAGPTDIGSGSTSTSGVESDGGGQGASPSNRLADHGSRLVDHDDDRAVGGALIMFNRLGVVMDVELFGSGFIEEELLVALVEDPLV